MKVNEIGTDVKFETVEEGEILWCYGEFYIKIEECHKSTGEKVNIASIETGSLEYASDDDMVSLYKNANLNLV